MNFIKVLKTFVFWTGDVTGKNYDGAQEANTGEALDPRKEEDEVRCSLGNHSNQSNPDEADDVKN